jgi:hypothetical protein
VKRLDEAARSGDLSAWDWYVRALAQHRLGRAAEARQCLERAERELAAQRQGEESGKRRPWAWWYRVELGQLRREAEALVKEAPAGPAPKEANSPGGP